MRKNILIIMAMLFSLVGYAYATPTCSILVPAANTAYNGTVIFNVSITSNGTVEGNVTGVNWSVSGSVVASSTLDGQNQSYYNDSNVDTSTITDVKQTTVTANVIMNSSVYVGSCTSAGVDFDNTDPSCSCTIGREYIETGDEIQYDCSQSSDTTTLTYSCVTTYDDATTETETASVGSFDQTYSLGEASTTCTVTDEVSKTNSCSAITTTIQGEDYTPPPEEQAIKDNTAIISIVMAVIVVIIIAGLVMTQRGSKKRRR